MDFRAFEATPGISVIVHPDVPRYTYAAVSDDFITTLGLKREEIVGSGLFETFPKCPRDPNATGQVDLCASFDYILKQKTPHEIPLQRYDLPDGEGTFRQKYWKVNNAPILSDTGEVLFIIHSSMDITDQVIAGEKPRSPEGIEKTYNFFMNAPVIIGYVKGEDYVIELANEGLLEVWGKTSEVIGKPLLTAIPGLEEQGLRVLLDKVRTSGEPFYAFEFPITLERNGSPEVLYFDFVYKPLYENLANGHPDGIISVGLDVTEKVVARKKVKESEEKYRTLFDTMDQGFCVLEMIFNENNKPVDYTFLETNDVFERQTGLKNAGGKTARQLVPDLEDHWFERYGRVALTGEPLRFTEGSKAMNRWFEIYAFPIRYDDGRKVALLFSDISERKKTEEALKLSEGNLRNVIQQSPVAMAILRGPSFVVEIANDRMFELWGRGREELLDKSIFEGLPEVRNQGYENLLNGVFTTGKTFSAQGIPVTLPRGGKTETVYINLLYEAFRAGDGTISGIMAVAVDVTDEVLARMKVEESNEEFKFVTDFMPQIIWATHPDGNGFYNKQWHDYTGLTYEQSLDGGWDIALHPDDLDRTRQLWRHCRDTGEPYQIEYRLKSYDGQYRWFLGRAFPLKDEAGNILKWYGTCTDIDDQKKSSDLLEEKVKERTMELEIQKNELKRSNASLEEFAYAASHDLKEPIRKIHTFSDKLKSKLKDRLLDSDRQYFERMERATERMQLLIDDLLEYSHISTTNHFSDDVDLNKKVLKVLDDLELEVANKKAHVIIKPLPVVKGNRRQLQQLFQNLITNALKFNKPGTTPEIRISSSVLKGEFIEGFVVSDEFKNTLFNVIEVADNGIGFEQEYSGKIFKMFLRLHGKAEYPGTGVGLAIAKKVAENHKGFINAESKPGEGASFRIYLPVN